MPSAHVPSRRHALRRSLLAVALVAAAIPTLVVGLASPASAAATVVVTPPSGLDPAGQSVTVAGSEFDSSGGKGVYVRLCRQVGESGTPAGRPAAADCDGSGVWVTDAYTVPGTSPWGADGSFSVSLTARAAFGTVDCLADGVVCGVSTRPDHTNASDYTQDTFTPVTFTAPGPDGPSFTVTPSSGLDAAADTVTVDGSGYPEGQGVYVRFCQEPTGPVGTPAGRPGADVCFGEGLWVSPTPPDPTLPVLADGEFSVDLDVVGRFAGTTAVIDCMEAGSCGVFVRRDHVGGAGDFALDAFVPVSFDPESTPPDVEEPEAPSLNDVVLTLSKTTDVLDGEVLTATGEDFTPNQGIYLQYCQAPTGTIGTAAGRATVCFPEQDGLHVVWLTPVPADGSFTSPITVVKTFELADGTEVDCSEPDSCGVFVRRDHDGGATDYSQDAFVAVSFGDGVAPPREPGRLAADRTTELDPDGDTITVEGTGFRPGVDYAVTLCDADDPIACDFDQVATVTTEPVSGEAHSTGVDVATAVRAVGDPGSFSVELDVRAAFGDVDCLEAFSGCAVMTRAVTLSEPADEVALGVTFASAPAGGDPTDPGGSGDPTAPGADPGTASGSLASTGADILRGMLIGLAAVLAGAAAVTTTRRRTNA